MMKAWQVVKNGEPGKVLALMDIDRPQPGPGEVLVRVEAAALSLPDVLMCRGVYALQPKNLPYTLGQEISGIVAAVGEGTTVSIGTRVMAVTQFDRGKGGFAEYALAYDMNVHPIPEELSAVDASVVHIAYGTAHICLVARGRIKSGETLLVHGGSGGVGAAVVQLGRHMGARIIATEVGEKKVDACRNLGAELAIDVLREDFIEVVNRSTQGRGVNMVFDPVGGEVFERSLDCLANEGRIVMIGYAGGSWFDAPSEKLVLKNISVVGAFMGAYGKKKKAPIISEIVKLITDKKIQPAIETIIPFNEIPQGLNNIEDRSVIGRIVARF